METRKIFKHGDDEHVNGGRKQGREKMRLREKEEEKERETKLVNKGAST